MLNVHMEKAGKEPKCGTMCFTNMISFDFQCLSL